MCFCYSQDLPRFFKVLLLPLLTVCICCCQIFLWGRAQTFQDSSGVTTMNFIVTLIQFLFAAAHLSTVKTASINKEVDKSKNEVIPFIDVYNKSSCQPREKLVEIPSEYPGDTEHTYVPSSVVLKRCGGCCSDEAMECVPTETRNTTLQVMRLRPMVSQHLIQLSFTEHQKCECRDKTDVTAKKEYHCVPCSERRKRLFVQDPLTCKCSCKFTQLDCKSRQLELNERSCRCERPRR